MNFKMTVSKITTIKVGSVLSGQIEAGKIEVGDEIIFEIQNEKNKLEVIGISDNDKKKRVNKAEKNQDVGLLVKEKQCEKIGLQEGMIIYTTGNIGGRIFLRIIWRYGSNRKCHRKKC